MDYQQFHNICSENGINMDLHQLEMIQKYCEELKLWNNQMNLISRKDTDNILEKHILHSLSVLKYVKLKPGSKCLDAGTGGGLPGIPIGIVRQDIKLLLVDSISKKIYAIIQMIKKLGCNNINWSDNRIEVLAEHIDYQSQFDYVLARAVSTIENIIKWTKRLVKQDSTIILYKGGDLSEEIDRARKQFPNYYCEEILIKLEGYDGFERDEKKIVICRQKENMQTKRIFL